MNGSGFPLTLAGIDLRLLPGRAVWWPAEQTLFVADLHWGKEATFRQRGGMPIPDITRHELDRLEQLLLKTDCRRMVLLGDLVHSSAGRSATVSPQVEQWRQGIARKQPELELLLIEGNHDQRSGALPESWGLTRLAAPVQIGPLTCAHYPEEAGPGPGLAGHLHPRIDLRRGPDRLRLPCFWLRGQQLTLPAFAWFASHSAIAREPGDRVFAIADEEVLELAPERGELSWTRRRRPRS
jgi:DNA ligase-associated metallophosphoesterase